MLDNTDISKQLIALLMHHSSVTVRMWFCRIMRTNSDYGSLKEWTRQFPLIGKFVKDREGWVEIPPVHVDVLLIRRHTHGSIQWLLIEQIVRLISTVLDGRSIPAARICRATLRRTCDDSGNVCLVRTS